jgi:hypothetical protein
VRRELPGPVLRLHGKTRRPLGDSAAPAHLREDRLDPVDPAASLTLDPELLARFPEGYRHLAYLQVRVGYPVKPDMPGLRGPEAEGLERLYERGAAWLAGESVGP